MKHTPPALIVRFIDIMNQYGLITDHDGIILHCNPHLLDVLKYAVSALDEVFGAESASIQDLIRQSVASKKMDSFNIEMDFGDGISQVFGQVYPLECETGYIAALLFHPVDSLRRLEKVSFDRQSKLPTDSRWVIDDEFKTLSFSADEDSIFYGREPGFSIFEAVLEKDHPTVLTAFDKAALTPGELVTICIDIQRHHGLCEVEVDIIYAPDMFYGNRYFVLTRPAVNRAEDILSRMSEAYQVDHDNALARCLNVGPPSISNVRTRIRELPDSWLVKCCLECRVNFHWLYAGLGKKFFD
ncbi:helix-turn-helix domain-containing protein [Maridesulfovibrio ferrireducens]|uniref:helix-turn-helix domain-containing protein n=1 Tax=Maridesulfovibrio ferrireducens TaxID=246191 RepID=UPI001A1B9172|nr:helix-turn-helix domain-containing protein [Maridesulfovibrio ferrireducens]MBI9110013.1 helix-turn-helix domain-containing protein [Maridesulfovibrio ferrireducens]